MGNFRGQLGNFYSNIGQISTWVLLRFFLLISRVCCSSTHRSMPKAIILFASCYGIKTVETYILLAVVRVRKHSWPQLMPIRLRGA